MNEYAIKLILLIIGLIAQALCFYKMGKLYAETKMYSDGFSKGLRLADKITTEHRDKLIRHIANKGFNGVGIAGYRISSFIEESGDE